MIADLPRQFYDCLNTRYFKRQILTANFVERHDRLSNDTTCCRTTKASAIRPPRTLIYLAQRSRKEYLQKAEGGYIGAHVAARARETSATTTYIAGDFGL